MAIDPRLMMIDYSGITQAMGDVGQGQVQGLAGKAMMGDPNAMQALQKRSPMMAAQVQQKQAESQSAQQQAEMQRKQKMAEELKYYYSQLKGAPDYETFKSNSEAVLNSGLVPLFQEEMQRTGEQIDEEDFLVANLMMGNMDKDTFDNASKLRGEFTKETNEFSTVNNSAQRVIDSASDPSAAGDLALIFNYMKILDPGSTVREGEFATAQNAGGADQRVISLYNRIINGERLSPEQRADFLNRAKKLYQGQAKIYDARVKEYESLAGKLGVPSQYVIYNRNLAQFPESEEVISTIESEVITPAKQEVQDLVNKYTQGE